MIDNKERFTINRPDEVRFFDVDSTENLLSPEKQKKLEAAREALRRAREETPDE